MSEIEAQTGDIQGRVAREAGITFAGAAVGAVLVLLNEVLAARFLGVESYGLFAVAFVVAKIAGLLSQCGLQVGVIRFIPTRLEAKEMGAVTGIVAGALAVPVLLGSAMAAVIWVLSDLLAASLFSKPAAAEYIRLLALAVPFLALTEVLGHIARAFGQSVQQVLIRKVIPAFVITMALSLLLLFSPPRVWVTLGFVAGYFIATSVGCGLVALLLRRHGTAAPKFALSALYIYSLQILLSNMLQLAVGWTDIMILGAIGTVEQVGVYRACFQIVLIFDLVQFALLAAVAQLIPVMADRKDHDGLAAIHAAVTRFLTLFAVLASVVIISNASDLLGLLGDDFRKGANALSLRALALAVRTSFAFSGVLLILGGRPAFETLHLAVVLALNVGLNLMLVPRFGVDGAAIATLISFGVLSLLRTIGAWRTFHVRTVYLFMGRIVLVAGLLRWAVNHIAEFLGVGPGGGIADLVLRVFALSIALTLAFWIIEIGKEDRRRFIGFLGRRLGISRLSPGNGGGEPG